MKKVLTIIGAIFVGFIVLFVIIFAINSATSKKLVCKSNNAKVTIMYNNKKLTGYTAVGATYDLDQQKTIADKIGVEEYLKQFDAWWQQNTAGNCTYE